MEDFLLRLKGLSAAEDFLNFFGIAFDQHVVNVSRLHILKRFFQYLRQQPGLPADNELELYKAYRRMLEQAYADFVNSTPAREKVFKVFQDTGGTQHVSLDGLRASLPACAAA